jgi:alpha-1,3-mannosyltransferase
MYEEVDCGIDKLRRGVRRVAHIVRQYHPSIGGLETYVEELARRQSGEARVYVITLNRVFGSSQKLAPLERQGRVIILRIPFLGFREFFIPFLRPSLLRRFSIVHVHATDQLLDAVAAVSWLSGLRYVVTTHGLFFHTARFKRVKALYLRFITRRSLSRSAAVFAVSANDRQTVEEVGIRAILLRNPIVPLGDFIAEGSDLIYIGRIAPNKRLEKLVDFARAVMERDPKIRLHIIGSDASRLWGGIAKTVEGWSLQSRILYHGYLSREEIRPILSQSGYVVSASRYEGYGLSIIEGMSVGLLPIMHDNAAFRETFSLSKSGLLVDFDDPERAAAEFLKWRGAVSAEDRKKAAEYAHAQSWDAVAASVAQAYRDALDAAH